MGIKITKEEINYLCRWLEMGIKIRKEEINYLCR